MNNKNWFLKNARVSRGAVARLAGVTREEVDAAADDVGCDARIRFDELDDVLEGIEEAAEEEGDDDESDDDEVEDEAAATEE
ncbi:MAG TPA: hypothetical protein VJN18_11610 [Polyangiaceae bacterium]|nr:hypothetical protein [Polyangiaceae bacterium]